LGQEKPDKTEEERSPRKGASLFAYIEGAITILTSLRYFMPLIFPLDSNPK
jgi:hypothetical protein